MGRSIRNVLLILLVAVLGFVFWLCYTRNGRNLGNDLSDRVQVLRRGGEEKEAAAKLKTLGARLGRSAPPDAYPVSITCRDLTLGDEGYQLIGKCFRLEAASFIHCDLNDERMQRLGELHDLSSLTISDAPEVTDAGIKNVAALQGLQTLSLRGIAVGDAGLATIAQLTDLKDLDLSSTRVTDAGVAALSSLHSLEWLLLANTEVTDEGVARLEGMGNLKVLTLTGSKVSGKGKAQLAKKYPGLKVE